MSGYNYSDQSGCPGCNDRSEYHNLGNMGEFVCDQKCLCRGTEERSNWDKMAYAIYEQGQNIQFPLLNSAPPVGNCGAEWYQSKNYRPNRR